MILETKWRMLKNYLKDQVDGAVKETGTSLYFAEILKKMERLEEIPEHGVPISNERLELERIFATEILNY